MRIEGVPPKAAGWETPPEQLRLGDEDVHVWRASLAPGRHATARAWSVLSPDERRRALRMRFPLHRSRSIASRGALRILLGRYLGLDPARVPIVTAPGGRPHLAEDAPRPLRFSVSHAGELGLFAFASGRGIGVDVERLRRELPFERLAARFFAAAEIHALAGLPRTLLPSAFFACWTRKEALFKAWGGEGGLVPALKRFAVPVSPDTARAGVTPPDAGAPWALATLDAGPGFAAALALESAADPACYRFDWPA